MNKPMSLTHYMVLKYIKDQERLTPDEKYLALLIAIYWSPSSTPFPSIKKLSQDSGKSKSPSVPM